MSQRILKLCVASLLNILCFPDLNQTLKPGGKKRSKVLNVVKGVLWKVVSVHGFYKRAAPPTSQVFLSFRISQNIIQISC